MLILLPALFMLAAALALLILRFLHPQFKYPWMIAAGGAVLALISVFLWRLRFPLHAALPPWQPVTLFLYVPAWVADGISFPYALALAALAVAVIWTSVARTDPSSMPWAGTLALCALGILAVTSDNPLTLVLAWSVIDLTELVGELGLHLADDLVLEQGACAQIGGCAHQDEGDEGKDEQGPHQGLGQAPPILAGAPACVSSACHCVGHDRLSQLPYLLARQNAADLFRKFVWIEGLAQESIESRGAGAFHLIAVGFRCDGYDRHGPKAA